MNKENWKASISFISQNIFYFIALILIAPPIESQTLAQKTEVNPKIIFQSQFSRNLAKNFQEAKSEGCFILYDLKRDRFSNIIFT